MKFDELVSVDQAQCKKCISYTYILPCDVDKKLFSKLRVFGNEKFSSGKLGYLKIMEPDVFYVESVLETRFVKIWFSKDNGVDFITNKTNILRNCICDWMSDIFNSNIQF